MYEVKYRKEGHNGYLVKVIKAYCKDDAKYLAIVSIEGLIEICDIKKINTYAKSN